MKKLTAILLILLLLGTAAVAGVYGDPALGEENEAASTVAAQLPAEEPVRLDPAEEASASEEEDPAGTEPKATELTTVEIREPEPETEAPEEPTQEPPAQEPASTQSPEAIPEPSRVSDDTPDATGTLTISCLVAGRTEPRFYLVEQHQADGSYLPLTQVAIFSNMESVSLKGLSLETGYRVTEQLLTKDPSNNLAPSMESQNVRLTENQPEMELRFLLPAAEQGCAGAVAELLIRKE